VRQDGKPGALPGVARRVSGVLALLAVLLVSTALGLLHRSRWGRVRARAAAPEPAGVQADGRDGLADVLAAVGAEPGERATLLQFSSAFCAPCRATRRVLGEVAELVPGVRHVEVDAEQHLEIVRQLRIRSTPTTLVLDADARETARATGQPRKAEVLAALGQAVP
jgi:thiol-disulfide isomerase/thioredoxin